MIVYEIHYAGETLYHRNLQDGLDCFALLDASVFNEVGDEFDVKVIEMSLEDYKNLPELM